jgi:hypothetical protein
MGKTQTDANCAGPLREVFDDVRFVRAKSQASWGRDFRLDENVYPSCRKRADNGAISRTSGRILLAICLER